MLLVCENLVSKTFPPTDNELLKSIIKCANVANFNTKRESHSKTVCEDKSADLKCFNMNKKVI